MAAAAAHSLRMSRPLSCAGRSRRWLGAVSGGRSMRRASDPPADGSMAGTVGDRKNLYSSRGARSTGALQPPDEERREQAQDHACQDRRPRRRSLPAPATDCLDVDEDAATRWAAPPRPCTSGRFSDWQSRDVPWRGRVARRGVIGRWLSVRPCRLATQCAILTSARRTMSPTSAASWTSRRTPRPSANRGATAMAASDPAREVRFDSSRHRSLAESERRRGSTRPAASRT